MLFFVSLLVFLGALLIIFFIESVYSFFKAKSASCVSFAEISSCLLVQLSQAL